MSDHDPRWGSDPRDRESTRDREPVHVRDVFLDHVDLPRTTERQLVTDRDREYSLRESESRTLSTVGAFRVVSSRDLADHDDRQVDPYAGDLRHLREQGLIRTIPMAGRKDVAVVLTDRGKRLLEARRHHHEHGDRQAFYADLKKPREMEHDAQIYGAYLREAERLREHGAHIDRIVLDYELKREYQEWLHERDRGHADADGRPDRTDDEVREWAFEQDLPYFDGHVHFPDLRIEYDLDGRHDHRDVEIVTLHYRGARGAAAARSGFRCYGGSSARTGRSAHPDRAEELL